MEGIRAYDNDAYTSTLKMEMICSFETMGDMYQAARRHILHSSL
jgi:hypothetical protein